MINCSRRLSSLALAALVAASCASPAPEPMTEAQAVQAAAPASSEFELPDGGRKLTAEQVRMRDGARLNTDVWLPATTGKFPVVLIRTPYKTEVSARSVFLKRALAEGYAIVQQHERGRYLSEGDMRMLGNADEDGWDTLDWIAAQDWSNGKVATYGCSSSAENQLKLATLGHPAHKAMIAYSAGVGVAEAGPFTEQGNFWRGGVWQQGWMDYFYSAMALAWPQLPPELSDAERRRLVSSIEIDTRSSLTKEALGEGRMHLPMVDIGKEIEAPDTEIEEYLRRGPSHPDWDDDRVTNADIIKVPGLWAEALYDISARSTVAFFDKTRAESAPGTQAVIITNGQHCAFGRETAEQTIGDRKLGDARFDYVERQMAWLDRWLKDDDAAAMPAAPVRAYMAGANRWAEFPSVPVAGRDPSRDFFLTSGGKANTLAGDGVLADAAAAAGVDAFTYDPASPVISRGGEIAGVGPDQEDNDGSYDQRGIEARPDVLVYTSEPLAEDLAVFGYVDVELFVRSDRPDTDFTVKLVDVAADGTAWNISDSIQRMRYREGEATAVFMSPGETYRIRPPPMLAANVFLKGHRVRLEVSSSNFPTYARNLNTAGDPYTTTETAIARNEVRHGGVTASRLVLPVVKLPAS